MTPKKKTPFIRIFAQIDGKVKDKFEDSLNKMKRTSGLNRDELINHGFELLLKNVPQKKES